MANYDILLTNATICCTKRYSQTPNEFRDFEIFLVNSPTLGIVNNSNGMQKTNNKTF